MGFVDEILLEGFLSLGFLKELALELQSIEVEKVKALLYAGNVSLGEGEVAAYVPSIVLI